MRTPGLEHEHLRTCRPLLRLLAAAWLALLPACATAPLKKEFFYCLPTVSYLRECPDFSCKVVAEIYNSDKLQLLEETGTGWWKVKSLRHDTVGWTQAALLSEFPLPVQIYYVTVQRLPLRSSPQEEAVSRQFLNFGDKVQKLAENQKWWRVLVEKDRSIGWLPADQVAPEVPVKPIPPQIAKKPASAGGASGTMASPPAKPAPLYVAAASAPLHQLPLKSSPSIKTLKLNDKVEPIAHSGEQWRKVRYLETGAEGWLETRLLREAPITEKGQIVPGTKRSAKKAASPKTPEPLSEEEEALEPEAM